MRNKVLAVALVILALAILLFVARGCQKPLPEPAVKPAAKPALPAPKEPVAAETKKALPQVISLIRKDDHSSDLVVFGMNKFAKEYQGKVIIKNIDVDKDPQMASFFKVEIVPSLVFIDRQGKVVSKHEGYLEEEEVKARIEMLNP